MTRIAARTLVALVAVERALPGQHFEQDRSEREQVAPCVYFAAVDLFGRHVPDRTQDGAVRVTFASSVFELLQSLMRHARPW